MTAVVIVEAVVILLLLILVAGLLKSHAEILRQLHRLGASGDALESGPTMSSTGLETAPINQVSGVDPLGGRRLVSLLHDDGQTLLAFLSSGCASCQVFWNELSRAPDLPSPDTRLVIVTKGPAGESPGLLSELAPEGVPVVMSDDAWDSFRVPLTPYFLLVDGNAQIIGEGSASSWRQLLRLFRRSAADTQHPAHMDTEQRERFTDTSLAGSGVEPGNPVLYDDPLDA